MGLLDSLKRNTKPAPTSPYEPKASQPADPGYQNFEEINETAQVIERDVAVSTSPYEEPAMPAGQGSVAVEEIDEEFDEGPSYVPFREKGPVSHIIGQTKILAIINQKGGVGKSTTAVNLAAALGAAGKEVLLVDLDPQGNATSGYGIDKRDIGQCVYNVLLGETPVEDVILANVGSLRGRYDYILIDCPPSLGLLTINALVAADKLLIPIQCEFYALEGVTKLLDSMKRVKSVLNPSLDIYGIVLTMYDSRTNLSKQVVDEVRSFFGDTVFKTLIPRTVKLSEAPSYGQPIIEYAPENKGTEAYNELAQEVIQRG